MHMRAATRNNVTNRLFMTTFLVAFSSVALSSALPCPSHTLDSDSPVLEQKDAQLQAQKQKQTSQDN
ncbi:Coa2 [Kluyveromyces lactis]|nr:Coa2 [Kluyveromyces lactis]